MTKKIRPGMDDFFPTGNYIRVLEVLLKGPKSFGDIQHSSKGKHGAVGVQLMRMQGHGLIEKGKTYGMYDITKYGIKVLKAVEAYRKVMRE